MVIYNIYKITYSCLLIVSYYNKELQTDIYLSQIN